MEHNDWDSARSPIIGSCGTQEQALLIDLTSSTCRRVRRGEIKRGDYTVTKGWLREGKGPRKRKVKVQALMDLREERYRRLAEPSGTGQVTLRGLSLGIPLSSSVGRREGTYLRRIRLSDFQIFLSDPEWCWMEAGPAFTLSFPDPSAPASRHLLPDDSRPAHSVFHRPSIN